MVSRIRTYVGGSLVGLLLLSLAACGSGAKQAAQVTSTGSDSAVVDTTPSAASPSSTGPTSAAPSSASPSSTAPVASLAGKVVVLDPGHHAGNARHLAQINTLVPDGNGGKKVCNTTGTSTNKGYSEARFTLAVARLVAAQLKAAGATVVYTRNSNSLKGWGPCVNVRGQLGNAGYRGRAVAADLKVSIHADGSYAAGARGFHIIVADKPGERAASDRLAKLLRTDLQAHGLRRSTYSGTSTGAIVHRSDLGTLNFSQIPTVMLEAGNMRSAADVPIFTTGKGRQRVADGIADAIFSALGDSR